LNCLPCTADGVGAYPEPSRSLRTRRTLTSEYGLMGAYDFIDAFDADLELEEPSDRRPAFIVARYPSRRIPA
jgi:hypothetical protein